jgi:thymidylate synthase ThyX
MTALLVFDNAKPLDLFIPSSMGLPNSDQMQGTAGEVLTELAGRICYDSLGAERSRNSQAYHSHIITVKHTSVMRHYNFTVLLGLSNRHDDMPEILACLLNKPGIWVDWQRHRTIEVTLNINSVFDWIRNPAMDYAGPYRDMGSVFNDCLKKFAPAYATSSIARGQVFDHYQVIDPTNDEQRWLTLYLSGSRGWSHEQVRHSWRCAVSQRSTRYCDESDSAWIRHPLLRDYLLVNDSAIVEEVTALRSACDATEKQCREVYDSIVKHLQGFLLAQNVDKFTARKQARGAARGYLGNALETEMLFSASVAQWHRILAQRNNPAADQEIHEMYRDEVVAIVEKATR